MTGRFFVAAIAVFIGACASSGPQAPATATAPPADVDAVASNAPETATEGEIYDLDAPNVETTASVAPDEGADEIICRREIITGTRMSQRVCRKRSDIEATESGSQEALRKMRQSGSQMEKGTAN